MIHVAPKKIRIREGETVTIRAFGDIHLSQKASDTDKLIEDLKDRKTDKTLFIDMGDSMDSIGGTAHKYFNPKSLKDEIMLADVPPLNAERDMLIKLLKKYTKPEEWLGHFSGNHPLMLLNTGLDLMQDVCSQCGHTYLGYQAYVPIQAETSGHRIPIMILGSHGFGGGGQRWEGAGVNAYIQHAMRYEGWDIALYGHRHDKWVKPLAKIWPYAYPSGARGIKEDIRIVAQCGTYLRTLSNGVYPTYSEKAGMTPRPLGCVDIQFKIVRERNDEGAKTLKVKFLNT